MNVATGHYVNIFKEGNNGFDLFIMLNEPNSAPTPEEVDKLTDIVGRQVQISTKSKDIRFAIENSGVRCVDFGFQLAYKFHTKE